MRETPSPGSGWLYVRANRVLYALVLSGGAALILSYAKTRHGWDPLGIALTIVLAALGVRGAMTGVRVEESKVVVRNFLATRSVPLSEVTGAELVRPWYTARWSVLAVTRRSGPPVAAINLSPGSRAAAQQQVDAAKLAITDAVARYNEPDVPPLS